MVISRGSEKSTAPPNARARPTKNLRSSTRDARPWEMIGSFTPAPVRKIRAELQETATGPDPPPPLPQTAREREDLPDVPICHSEGAPHGTLPHSHTRRATEESTVGMLVARCAHGTRGMAD